MTHEEFDRLVQSVENGVGRNPAALQRRVMRLALLGYAGLLAPLALVLLFSLAFIIPGILWPQDAALLMVIGALIFFAGLWGVASVLWIRLPPPEGRTLTRAETPALFDRIDELQKQLRSAPFHRVLVVPACNAAVLQRPRLGVFGWQQNNLLVGLTLMEELSKDEFVAVLAHEFAHLSRQHNRSGQWIYRLRRSWEQVFARLSRPRVAGEVSLRPLIQTFVKKFWPRFNGHAFVLSRAQEYQADEAAAQVTGQEIAATALIRIARCQNMLERKVWPDVWQLANTAATPPEGIFLQIRESLSGLALNGGTRFLEQAFRATTTNADTHPCLSDRLRAIGWSSKTGVNLPALPIPSPNAAEVLLGTALPAIRKDVEQHWRKESSPRWQQQHGKAGFLHDRLGQLGQEGEVRKEDLDVLWDKARVFMELRQFESAAPILRQILASNPRHVAGNFNLGIFLLKSGDAEGEKFLEKALSENEELLPQAVQALHAYYQSSGQPDRIKELYARMDRYEKAIKASREERSNITAADKLIPHELSEAELTSLRDVIATDPEIVAVDLGRKELQYFVKQKLFLLCVRVRPAWHRLPDSERQQRAVNRLIKTVRVPGRVFIFAPSGNFRGVAKKLRHVEGARIFTRGE
jgi:Zn-dependent protease with chaperone function